MKDWKTTLTGIGSACLTLLAAVAALPYSMGDITALIPSEYKTKIFIAAAISAFILKVVNSILQKDATTK